MLVKEGLYEKMTSMRGGKGARLGLLGQEPSRVQSCQCKGPEEAGSRASWEESKR